jgi:hypothetical protein
MGEFKITKSKRQQKGKKDIIRIKGNKVELGLNIYKGKQDGFILYYCPAIEVSGYGMTDKEAFDFIKENLEVFSHDVLDMHTKEREHFLATLGFKKERFHNKNFSKAYVDEDGILKNFDKGTVERQLLQTA